MLLFVFYYVDSFLFFFLSYFSPLMMLIFGAFFATPAFQFISPFRAADAASMSFFSFATLDSFRCIDAGFDAFRFRPLIAAAVIFAAYAFRHCYFSLFMFFAIFAAFIFLRCLLMLFLRFFFRCHFTAAAAAAVDCSPLLMPLR